MIDYIHIENFKSLKDIDLVPKRLNVLMGLNGMGKSSVLQALLLLRQNGRSDLLNIQLNGELVSLGRGQDVMYQWNQGDTISIMLGTDRLKEIIECTMGYESQNNVLRNQTEVAPALISQCELFGKDFCYLHAERTGPLTDYPASYADVVEGRQLGTHGQFAVHFINEYGTRMEVPEALRHPSASSSNLLSQTIAWLGEIAPDVKLHVQEIQGTDKVLLQYSYSVGNSYSNYFRPTNVGYGISYVLPVIVALLTTAPDRLVLIENPEAHIHPKGQTRLGRLIALAAAAGTQLFVETHSDHLINGIRVSVRQGDLSPEDVEIQYFSKTVRDNEQFSQNKGISIDSDGRLSDYPADFMDEWENQLRMLF
ncbi:MAG: DUF3696 domain-containing protein [Bacteroides sp.]|nr:DUF3696 domain-containing protein [Bacteroides sp.]MCM1095792.1 DUF3696 domain-containing protein [Terasakiella sp.]